MKPIRIKTFFSCNKCHTFSHETILIDPKNDVLDFVGYHGLPDAIRHCFCECKHPKKALEQALEYVHHRGRGNKCLLTIANLIQWCVQNETRYRKNIWAVDRLATKLYRKAPIWNPQSELIQIAIDLWNETIPTLISSARDAIEYPNTTKCSFAEYSLTKSILFCLIAYTIIVSDPLPEAIQFINTQTAIEPSMLQEICRGATSQAYFRIHSIIANTKTDDKEWLESQLDSARRHIERWQHALTPKSAR